MDKLEAIKNKLREMNNECKASKCCTGCINEDKCYNTFGLSDPEDALKIIEEYENSFNIEKLLKVIGKCEKLLND